MKPQTLVMLIVALGCGLSAMFLTQRYLAKPVDTTPKDTVDVVVSTVTIQSGQPLNETMVKVVPYPKEHVPADAINTIADVVGFPAKHQIDPDEIVRKAKLGDKNSAGISVLLEKGQRAFTVGITTHSAVAGFIKPGARVDIMMTMSRRGNGKPAITKTILQDILVLAVNTEMLNPNDPENRGKAVEMVTFAVTPEQSERLALAQSQGSLTLNLRGPNDNEEVSTKGLTEDDLTSSKKETVAIEEKPEAIMIDQTVAPSEPSLMDQFTNLLAAAGKNAPVVTVKEEPAPVVEAPPAPPAPPAKKYKKLVYRDNAGNPLFEVKIEAESPLANSLNEMVEDFDDNTQVSNP